MYRSSNSYYGLPERLYRDPRDIRRDMAEISESIREIDSRLNVRSLLLNLLSESDANDPHRLVSGLEAALAEAESALVRLGELKEELSGLDRELYEVRCEMGL